MTKRPSLLLVTALATVPHGGAGIVSTNGSVGPLRLDRSTAVAVQRFAGPADYLGIGTFRTTKPPSTPLFLALGYECRHVRNGGIPTDRFDPRHYADPVPSGTDCLTVYYIDERTNRLSLFTTRSRHFVTAHGTRPGVPWSRLHDGGYPVPNCEGQFVEGRGVALNINNAGGKEPGGDPAKPITGGRVYELELTSSHHPLGLECPTW